MKVFSSLLLMFSLPLGASDQVMENINESNSSELHRIFCHSVYLKPEDKKNYLARAQELSKNYYAEAKNVSEKQCQQEVIAGVALFELGAIAVAFSCICLGGKQAGKFQNVPTVALALGILSGTLVAGVGFYHMAKANAEHCKLLKYFMSLQVHGIIDRVPTT